jgi:hypothetical protein
VLYVQRKAQRLVTLYDGATVPAEQAKRATEVRFNGDVEEILIRADVATVDRELFGEMISVRKSDLNSHRAIDALMQINTAIATPDVHTAA